MVIREIEEGLKGCECVCRPCPDENWYYAKPGSYLEHALLNLDAAEATIERERRGGEGGMSQSQVEQALRNSLEAMTEKCRLLEAENKQLRSWVYYWVRFQIRLLDKVPGYQIARRAAKEFLDKGKRKGIGPPSPPKPEHDCLAG